MLISVLVIFSLASSGVQSDSERVTATSPFATAVNDINACRAAKAAVVSARAAVASANSAAAAASNAARFACAGDGDDLRSTATSGNVPSSTSVSVITPDVITTPQTPDTKTFMNDIIQSRTDDDECIVLIGGYGDDGETLPAVELYHPSASECSETNATRLLASAWRLNATMDTSACHMRRAGTIAIRETPFVNKPPVAYRLADASSVEPPFPYNNSAGEPTAVWASTTAAVADGCVSCGGAVGTRYLDDCFAYDHVTDRWSPAPAMPRPLQYAASAALGDDYYVVGGMNSAQPSDQVYRYNIVSGRWHTDEAPMPLGGRHIHAAVALPSGNVAGVTGDELLVCGGAPGWRNDCEIYEARTKRWRRVAGRLREGRMNFAMVLFDGQVYALGGDKANGRRLDTVERYHTPSDSWQTLERRLNSRRGGFVAVVV